LGRNVHLLDDLTVRKLFPQDFGDQCENDGIRGFALMQMGFHLPYILQRQTCRGTMVLKRCEHRGRKTKRPEPGLIVVIAKHDISSTDEPSFSKKLRNSGEPRAVMSVADAHITRGSGRVRRMNLRLTSFSTIRRR